MSSPIQPETKRILSDSSQPDQKRERSHESQTDVSVTAVQKTTFEILHDFFSQKGIPKIHLSVLFGENHQLKEFIDQINPQELTSILNSSDQKGWKAIHFAAALSDCSHQPCASSHKNDAYTP